MSSIKYHTVSPIMEGSHARMGVCGSVKSHSVMIINAILEDVNQSHIKCVTGLGTSSC